MELTLLQDPGLGFHALGPMMMLLGFGLAVLVVAALLKGGLRRLGAGRSRGIEPAPRRAGAVPRDAPPPNAPSRVYPAATGLRIVTLAGGGAALWILCPETPGGTEMLRVPGLSLSGPNAWTLFAALAVLAMLYGRHIWIYRIELAAGRIRYPRFGFHRASHDLRDLERIEDGGPYGLRLYFRDGRRGDLMKQVRGMHDMMNRLRAHLD